MGENSGIEWIRGEDGSPGATWNPVIAIDCVSGRRGSFCYHVSEGCRFCWASKMNVFRGTGLEYIQQNLDRHRFEIITDVRSQRSIDWPLRKRKSIKIFPCSMTDLFAPWHTDEMIDRIFATMAFASWHTFIITTKQAERMSQYMDGLSGERLLVTALETKLIKPQRDHVEAYAGIIRGESWPLRNVWLGVSVEDQKTADERVPLLCGTHAAIKWISAEPLLGPIDFQAPWGAINPEYPKLGIHWVVVGGESGPQARPMHPEWARFILQQCQALGVPFFFKQWGEWSPFATQAGYAKDSLWPGNDEILGGDCGGFSGYAMPHKRHGKKFANIAPYPEKPKFVQVIHRPEHTWGKNNLLQMTYLRAGKKAAGRLLDGREWNQFPI